MLVSGLYSGIILKMFKTQSNKKISKILVKKERLSIVFCNDSLVCFNKIIFAIFMIIL